MWRGRTHGGGDAHHSHLIPTLALTQTLTRALALLLALALAPVLALALALALAPALAQDRSKPQYSAWRHVENSVLASYEG